MKKVLLFAYGCEPGKGSEAGLGWHWSTNLAKNYDVYVLTHPRGREAIQNYLEEHPNPQLHFKYVELPQIYDIWKWLPGEQGIQLRYILWQFAAYQMARRLVKRIDFDIVHHVSWATVTGPTLGWALNLPFIWGPIGGGQKAPLRLRRFLGTTGWIKETLRNLEVNTVTLNPIAVLAARKCSVAIAANPDTFELLERLRAPVVAALPDFAIDQSWPPGNVSVRPIREKPVIVWMGRFIARKAPGLAVEAFSIVRAQQAAELWFLGDGPLVDSTRKLAEDLDVIEDVKFLGSIPHSELPSILEKTDIFLFTSLRDTQPSPVLEALATGLPAVLLDQHGAASISNDAAIKVPVTDADGTVQDLANALLELVRSPERRYEMGMAGYEFIRRWHTWDQRYGIMRKLYALALEPSHFEQEERLSLWQSSADRSPSSRWSTPSHPLRQSRV